jgi:hypothetical protein
MDMKFITSASLIIVLFGIAPFAFAATDYLLELDGLKGESTKSAETVPAIERPVACTMDARACPDGSFVGRVAPNCEFAPCPGSEVGGVAQPPPPKPGPLPPGDPDFDLLKVSPPPTNPVYKDNGLSGENPLHESGKKTEATPQDPEEGKSIEPEEIDFRDDDDDADGVPTAEEDIETSVSVSSVTVRGWDPKKKEEFMSERKEAAQVRSKQELEHFAQGILLEDEKIEEVQFNPKEVSVSFESEGKLLWLIPVSFTERIVAKGEEDDIATVSFDVKKPWWGFLVSGDNEGEEVAKEAEKKHKETIEISSWSWGMSNQASLLKTISNVLKTKHDTAKNSVSNVR